MYAAGLLLLFFMIGYLSHMKLYNSSDYNIPELNIEVYFVLYELNNTFIPSTFFKVKERDSDKKFESKTFSEPFPKLDKDIVIKSKVEDTEYFETSGDDSEIIKILKISEPENFDNIKSENSVLINSLDESVNFNISVSVNIKNNENDMKKFGNDSIILYKNNSIVLEVKDETKHSTSTNITNEATNTSGYESFCYKRGDANKTNITSEYLNDWWFSDDKYFMKHNRTNKISRGIYVAINPCLHNDFKIVKVTGYEFVVKGEKVLSNAIRYLAKENNKDTNIVWVPSDKSLMNTMAVYYEDMSLLDYSLSDILKRAYYPCFWLMLIVGVSFLFIYSKPLRSYYYYSKRNLLKRNPRPYVTFDDTENCSITKAEIMNLVLEIREIQNHSIGKMELVFDQTNAKLHYILQKLSLVEDFIIGNKMRETQEVLKSVIEFSKSNHKQIKGLKTEQTENADMLHSFSETLHKTKSDLEELRNKYKNLSKSQTSIIKELHEIKFNLTSNSKKVEQKKDVKSKHNLLESFTCSHTQTERSFEDENVQTTSNQVDTATSTSGLKHGFLDPLCFPPELNTIHNQEASTSVSKIPSPVNTAYFIHLDKKKMNASFNENNKDMGVRTIEHLKPKERLPSIINLTRNSETQLKTKSMITESKINLNENCLLKFEKYTATEQNKQNPGFFQGKHEETKAENKALIEDDVNSQFEKNEEIKEVDEEKKYFELTKIPTAGGEGKFMLKFSKTNEVSPLQKEDTSNSQQIKDKESLVINRESNFSQPFSLFIPPNSKQIGEEHQRETSENKGKTDAPGSSNPKSYLELKYEEDIDNMLKNDSSRKEMLEKRSSCGLSKQDNMFQFEENIKTENKIEFPEIKLQLEHFSAKELNVTEGSMSKLFLQQSYQMAKFTTIKEETPNDERTKKTPMNFDLAKALKEIQKATEEQSLTYGTNKKEEKATTSSIEDVKIPDHQSLDKIVKSKQGSASIHEIQYKSEITEVPQSNDKRKSNTQLNSFCHRNEAITEQLSNLMNNTLDQPQSDIILSIQERPTDNDETKEQRKRSRSIEKLKETISRPLNIEPLKKQFSYHKRFKTVQRFSNNDKIKDTVELPKTNDKVTEFNKQSPVSERKKQLKIHSSYQILKISKDQLTKSNKTMQESPRDNNRINEKMEQPNSKEKLKPSKQSQINERTKNTADNISSIEKVKMIKHQTFNNEKLNIVCERPKGNHQISEIPTQNNEKFKRIKQVSPSREINKNVKVHSTSIERAKFTKEISHNNEGLKKVTSKMKETKSPQSHEAVKKTTENPSNNEINKQFLHTENNLRNLNVETLKSMTLVRADEKKQVVTNHAQSSESESYLKHKTTVSESAVRKNLETNPLFKKQMSLNSSNKKAN